MSTELAVIEPTEIDFFSPDEPDLGSDIENLLVQIQHSELRLASSYVRLGLLLLRAQSTRFWGGHASFAQYLGSIAERIGRQRSQLYAYTGVAEKLLPYISEDNLLTMGISRAIELVRYVNQSGLSVPPHLIEAALDNEIKLDRLHTKVAEALHIKTEVKGTWKELGGFYCEPDEWKEIQEARNRAIQMDTDLASMPDHIQRKHIMLAWVREFVSSNPQEEV